MENIKYHLSRLKGPAIGALIGIILVALILLWLTAISPYR